MNESEQQELAAITHIHPSAQRAYQLIQAFGQMVRQREGQRLEEWLKTIAESPFSELRTFAAGIQRDKAAVEAGLTLTYSNGPVEGHVNRLKLIKRSMYGRARFDLLRQRVLCAS